MDAAKKYVEVPPRKWLEWCCPNSGKLHEKMDVDRAKRIRIEYE